MKYYITLGLGQPYYPGYFICIAENEDEARKLASDALNNHWDGIHYSFNDIHPLDRIYRGIIDATGLVCC